MRITPRVRDLVPDCCDDVIALFNKMDVPRHEPLAAPLVAEAARLFAKLRSLPLPGDEKRLFLPPVPGVMPGEIFVKVLQAEVALINFMKAHPNPDAHLEP